MNVVDALEIAYDGDRRKPRLRLAETAVDTSMTADSLPGYGSVRSAVTVSLKRQLRQAMRTF